MDQDATLEDKQEQDQSAGEQPSGDEHPEKAQPEYEIDIFRDWCKGCGICAEFCPRKCIVMDAEGKPVIDRPERCTGCRWCELHCPDFAICVKELAAKEVKPEEAD